MKIGMVSGWPPAKDGIGMYSGKLAGHLKGEVVTIGYPGCSADYIIDFHSMSLKRELEAIIEKEGLDVLHIQYVAAYFGKRTLNLNLIRALSQKIPVVVTLHEVHYRQDGLRNMILSMLEKAIVSKASQVIVHTGNQARFLRKSCRAKNVSVVYMGTSARNVKKKSAGKELLMFGIMSRGKGIAIAIKAMHSLPEYHLTVAGRIDDPALKAGLERLASKQGNVTFMPSWVPNAEADRLFRKADAVLMPYTWAPYQSAVLHDAVAYGKPVVVSSAGAVHEIPDEFRFGVVIRPGSAEALSFGVRKLFSRYSFYQGNIKSYAALADWKNVARETGKIYKVVMRHGKV